MSCPHLCPPPSVSGYHRGTSGSGFANLSRSVELPVRSALGADSAQPQHSLHEDAEVEQTPAASSRPRVSFADPGANVGVAQELEDEEEDDHDCD